jgi:serine/threonine protein kinase
MTDSHDNKGQLPTVSKPTSGQGGFVPAEMPDIEGYRIIDKVGEGGMATVWRALQLSTQRQVALKVLGAGTFASKKARLRFEREVELTARLEHPNIARIYESGLHRGTYYYAMELFEGEHLDKYILARQPTHRQILDLFHLICRAVQYAHQQGVIHRDLKPSNIIVTQDGQPHILDFGLAKAFLESDKSVTVSVDGDIAGTPAYMSPEQAAGHFDSIDTRTDVYSIGVILFNVLTNQWPYDISGSQYEVLKNIQVREPVRPSKIVPHFDSDAEAILLKALAKDPGERYQSITELANDINAWLHGFPILARSVNTLYLLKKLIVRHAAASIVLCLLLVIIVNTSFISLYSYTRARAALKKSQLMQQTYEIQSKKNLALANQAVFALFLELWHDEKISRAQGAARFFADRSRERAAASFLLDRRPLNEKLADFQKKLSTNDTPFAAFILGEYHLKNENISEAIAAYRQCLDAKASGAEWDDWFKNTAQARLNDLSNGRTSQKSDGGIKGAE